MVATKSSFQVRFLNGKEVQISSEPSLVDLYAF